MGNFILCLLWKVDNNTNKEGYRTVMWLRNIPSYMSTSPTLSLHGKCICYCPFQAILTCYILVEGFVHISFIQRTFTLLFKTCQSYYGQRQWHYLFWLYPSCPSSCSFLSYLPVLTWVPRYPRYRGLCLSCITFQHDLSLPYYESNNREITAMLETPTFQNDVADSSFRFSNDCS